MAEANVMEVEMVDYQGGPMKYFCHKCSTEIDPKLPDLTCPLCDSGCVEELTENLRRDREAATSASPNVTNQLLMGLLASHPSSQAPYDPNDDDDEDEDDDVGEVWSRSRNSISSLSSSSRRRSLLRDRGLPLHSFIETVLDSLRDDSYRRFGNDFSEPRLRRYSRDFRRNYGGLEDLFTQILTQLTSSGPEPASQSQIDELPRLGIKQEHLDKSVQCSICLENFILHEEVTTLPCSHLHHRYCITPWLQLHGTCPVCRHILSSPHSPEPASSSSPFHFTDRADLSLDLDDVAYGNATEDIDAMSINLSVHPAWETGRFLGPEEEQYDPVADVAVAGRPAAYSPDIEMVALENNNVAMDVEFNDGPATEGAVGALRVGEGPVAETDLPGRPASMLTYLKDIEFAGIDSELESDL